MVETSTNPCKDNSVCLSGDQPASMFLQLKTRPLSRSNKCLPAELEQNDRLCQSPLVPNRMSPQPSTSARGSGNIGGTSLEGSNLVCTSFGNVIRLPMPDSPTRLPFLERSSAKRHRSQLAIWSVSGRDGEVATFLRRLQCSCLPLRGQNPHSHMNLSLASGFAGV